MLLFLLQLSDSDGPLFWLWLMSSPDGLDDAGDRMIVRGALTGDCFELISMARGLLSTLPP